MPATRKSDQIKPLIRSELIRLLQEDKVCRQTVAEITGGKYAEKDRTEDRFDRILDELKADRERQDERWEENQKKWEDNQKKWEENQRVINGMLASIKNLDRKYEAGIGALGARWGLHSEASFRNGLKAILEDSFKVKVERYQDFDEHGTVFGRPDQVELDVIIFNSSLILCEIKSSMSKSDMYAFWRKKEFYEQRHQSKADRLIVISPMVDPQAQKVASDLGLEVYSYPDHVDLGNSQKSGSPS